jgi:hypothetical protein
MRSLAIPMMACSALAACAPAPAPRGDATERSAGDEAGARSTEPEVDTRGAWRSSTSFLGPIRVTPLDRPGGEATQCEIDGRLRDCDIEVTAAREVYYRRSSFAVAASLSPRWSLRHVSTGAVFALETDGSFSGTGLYGQRSVQVLFCRLTAEPALECGHEFRPETRGQVWNETNCAERYIIRANEGALVGELPSHPDEPPSVIARVEPPASTREAQALALFLYAAHLIDGDTEYHTPYVSDMQVGD